MTAKGGILGLVAICAVVVLLSVAGLAWGFLTGLGLSLDGLLLLLVCLMMGGIFSLMLLMIAKEAGWLARLPLPRRKRAAAEAPAAAGNPVNPPAGQRK